MAKFRSSPLLLLLAAVVMGCGGGHGAPGSSQVKTTNNPLVALYTIQAPSAATVSVEFGPTVDYGRTTWAQNAPSGGGTVSILVAGMRANTTYHMRAIVNLADGTQSIDGD